MAEGRYDHLIRIVYQSIGASEVTGDIEKVMGKTDKLSESLESKMLIIGKAMKGLGFSEDQAKQVFGGFEAGSKVASFTTKDINALKTSLAGIGANKRQIDYITNSLTASGQAGKASAAQMGDFERAMKRALIVAPVWLAMRAGMMAVISLVRSQAKFLVELETAMARIKIVGKGTAEEFGYMKDALIALSYAYGTSATDAVAAAQIFAQQGLTVRETIFMTQQAMLASQVLGQDVKTTVENLTAALRGFNLPMTSSISIIDKWINVEKEFAVTAQDLANATKVTGATANQLGITLSAFLGDVTAVVEVTRKSGEEAARGLGFIYARLLTTGKKTVEQIAQIPFYLNEQNEATDKQTGTLRNATAILDDLALKWNSLSTEERLEIASSVASKRQMTVLNALMQNHNRSLDARIKALTSAGAAERAFGIIQETTAFKVKQLDSAWNNLTNAVGDTSGFKAGIGIVKNMVINLTYLIDKEKAYREVMSEPIAREKRAAEALISEAQSLKEIITLRDKLSKAPTTDENLERIKILNAAIEAIATKEIKVKLAIESGDPKQLDKALQDLEKKGLERSIKADISLKFEPKIASQEELIKSLESQTKGIFAVGGTEGLKIKKQLAIEQSKLNVLYGEQNKELEIQLATNSANLEIQKGISDEIEEIDENSSKLIEKEKEQFNFDRQNLLIEQLYSDNLEEQIQKKKELIDQSDRIFSIHQQTIEKEKLETELIKDRIKERDKEKKTVTGLLFELEKAGTFEQDKIKRQIELATMQPEEVQRAFESDEGFDRQIIIDNISNFAEETQKLIAETLAREFDLERFIPDEVMMPYQKPTYTGGGGGGASPAPERVAPRAQELVIQNLINKGAENVNVKVDLGGMATAEETANLIAEMVKNGMMADEDFVNAFAKKLNIR